MKKAEYEKYIIPSEFAALYEEWKAKGKPQGNDKLYAQVWDGVTNAVKACVGALQARYHCRYQDYGDRVMDSTILIMNKLLTMDDTPKNIVSMCYLPVLGICCGPKAIQSEWENNAESLDAPTEGGDTFAELIYLGEEGKATYNY